MDKIEELENKIQELENKRKELSEELNKLKKENKAIKRWRVERGKLYWYIDDRFDIKSTPEFRHQEDIDRYNIGNYFETEKQAKVHRDKLLIYQQLKDLALELNDGEEIDWNDDNQIKYYIYYDYEDDYIGDDLTTYWKDIGQVYCLNGNFKDIALERIREDNLKKLLMEE